MYKLTFWGWSGGAKVSCILRHRGIQLILAYSWTRPAILVAGKRRGGMFLFLHFHSCSFLYACLKNGTYYVMGYGVRPSVRKLFRFWLTPLTVYIGSS